jgi:hypothetical protein
MNKICFIPKIIDKELVVEILIDDESLPKSFLKKDLPADPFNIRKSVISLGKYECPIFTCSCGIAECAGIHMLVLANSSTVSWKMEKPVKMFYIFDYEQYAKAYEDFQKGLKYLLDVKHVRLKMDKKDIKLLLEDI